MSYTVKVAENDNAILKIVQDDDSSNPRTDFDNFGHMVCWHRGYNLGDEHNYSEPREFLEEMVKEISAMSDEEIEEMEINDLLLFLQEEMVILPLYLYDHSGITMNTTGFSCSWDSGQVGFTYATKEEIIKEYGSYDTDKARELLIAEVATYDQYLRGDVYGFILEKKVKCECCDNIESEHVDSCWGFYGLEYIEGEIKSYIPEEYAELVDELKWA